MEPTTRTATLARLLLVVATSGTACSAGLPGGPPELITDETDDYPADSPPPICEEFGCATEAVEPVHVPEPRCAELIARLVPRPDLGSCSVRFPPDVHFVSGGVSYQDPDHENYLVVEDLFQFPDTQRFGAVVWRDGFARCIFDDCAFDGPNN